MPYQQVIEKFDKIQEEIKKSNHDAMSYEDYEAEPEEITECLKAFGLAEPEYIDKHTTILPQEYITEAFGEVAEEDFEKLTQTEEYKKLVSLYDHLYDQIVVIATEMSAYYENEARDYEKYLDSMRGII